MPSVTKWEYLAPVFQCKVGSAEPEFSDMGNIKECLAGWGREGWELVAVVPLPTLDEKGRYREFRYIFKRPRGFVE